MSLLTSKATAKDLVGSSSSLTACAASGAYTSSGAIDIGGHRKLTIFIAYNADASATAGVLSLVPLFSAAKGKVAPGATDDAWFALGAWDGTVTAGTLTASSLPAGSDFTVSPDFARVLHRAADIRTEPSDAGTDKIRIAVTLDVTPYTYAQILYAEAGDTTNPGDVWLSYVLSA